MSRTPNRRPVTAADLPPATVTPPPAPVDGLPPPLAGGAPAAPGHPLDAAALPQGRPADNSAPRPPPDPTSLTVREVDGDPSIDEVAILEFAGATVTTQPAEGERVVVRVTVAGGLTVAEVDGAPSIAATTLELPNGTVTEPTPGVARYTPAAAGLGQLCINMVGPSDYVRYIATYDQTLSQYDKTGPGDLAYEVNGVDDPTGPWALAAGDYFDIFLTSGSASSTTAVVFQRTA